MSILCSLWQKKKTGNLAWTFNDNKFYEDAEHRISSEIHKLSKDKIPEKHEDLKSS